MSTHFTGRYRVHRGALVFDSPSAERLFELFLSRLAEGQVIDAFYEVTHDDGSLPQLAKLHVLIRQLAIYTGNTVEDMKLLVKDRAGLCIVREVSGKEYFLAKSFGECSREELSLAIQACVSIGEEVNCLVT